MALQMGEVEVKIKANVDDAKGTLQELEGADIDVQATVTVDDSELSEVLDGAHEVKITAVNDTSEGVEEANSALETVEDKQSDITAEDSTAEGVDAANSSLENVEDTSASITAEDSTAEAVNSANTALSSVEDESVAITATDNTGGVIDGIESNLDAIEDESLSITAEDKTGETISTIETNLSAIKDEGVTITAEDETGSTIETISSNLSEIEDEGVTITAEDDTGNTIETVETNLGSIKDEEIVISAADDTGDTIDGIETTLSAIQDEEITITASADTTTAQSDLNSLAGTATITPETSNIQETLDGENYTALVTVTANAAILTESITNALKGTWDIAVKVASVVGDVAGFAIDVGSAIWNAVVGQAKEYDDDATMAAKMGIDYDEYMFGKWMADQIDTDNNTKYTLQRQVKTQLEGYYRPEGYGDSSKEASEAQRKWENSTWFKVFGGTNAENGDLTAAGYKTAEQAFETFGAAKAMEMAVRYIAENYDKNTQYAGALELFGTRGSELIPWINAVRSGRYDEYVEKYGDPTSIYGAATSDNTQEKLGSLADARADFLSCIDALANFGTSLMAQPITDTFTTLTNTIEEVYKIFNDPDENLTPEEKGEKILDVIKNNLTNLWEGIKQWFNTELWPILEPLLETIVSVLGQIIKVAWLKIKEALPDEIKGLLGIEDTVNYQGFSEAVDDNITSKSAYVWDQRITDEDRQTAMDATIAYVENAYGAKLSDKGVDFVGRLFNQYSKDYNWTWEYLLQYMGDTDWAKYLSFMPKEEEKKEDTTSDTKTDKTTTDGTTTETSTVTDLVAPISESTAAVTAATTACSDATSTLAATELKAGDVNVNNNVTVNCNGTEASVSSSTTSEVTKYNENKSNGKSFSNGAGRGK